MYILNSANGGDFAACEEKSQPLTQSISQQILTYAAMALAAMLIAEGTIGTGGLGTVPAIAAAMRIVGITSLTWSSTSYAAGKCSSSEKCHRGSIQAQGSDIAGPGTGTGKTKSEKWAQITPLAPSQGLALLDALIAKLTPDEARLRATQLAKARDYMIRASQGGGVCPPGQSFGDAIDPSTRVDVDIKAGTAFVP